MSDKIIIEYGSDSSELLNSLDELIARNAKLEKKINQLANQSLPELQKAIAQTYSSDQVDKFIAGADKAATAMKKVGTGADEAGKKTNELFKLKFENLVDGLEKVKGSLGLTKSMLALFGTESEDLNKAISKVGATLEVVNGLVELQNSLTKKTAVSTFLYGTTLKVVEFIQKAFAVSAATAWAAATAGISLLVTGAVLLVQNFGSVKSIFEKVTDKLGIFGATIKLSLVPLTLLWKGVQFLAEKLGITNSALDKQNEKIDANLKKLAASADATTKKYNREIAEAQAAGKTTTALEKEKADETRKTVEKQIAQYEKKKKLGVKLNEEEKNELKKLLDEKYDLETQSNALEIKLEKEASDEKARIQKEADDKAVEQAKKTAERLKKAKEDLQDAEVEAIDDSTEQEIAREKLNLQRKLDAITGNSRVENDLRKQLKENSDKVIAGLQLKGQEDDIKEQLESSEALIEQARTEGLAGEIKYQTDLYNARKTALEKQRDLYAKGTKEFNDFQGQIVKLSKDYQVELTNIEFKDTLKNEKKYHDEQLLLISDKYAKGLLNKKENDTAVKEENDRALETERQTYVDYSQDVTEIDNELTQKQIENNEEVAENTEETIQREIEARQKQFDNMINGARKVSSILQNIDKTRLNIELRNFKRQLDTKQISQETYEKKVAEARKRAAKHEKALAIFNVIIDTAQAVQKAIKESPETLGLPWSALALISGGIQVALIAAEPLPEYAKGVIGLKGPGTETSDSITARLSRGESVITAEKTRRYKDELMALHQGNFEQLIYKNYVLPEVMKAQMQVIQQNSSRPVSVHNHFNDEGIISAVSRNRRMRMDNVDQLAEAILFAQKNEGRRKWN